MSNWGQGSLNNSIGWGQAPKQFKTNGDFGKISFASYAGGTNITGIKGKGPKEEEKKRK